MSLKRTIFDDEHDAFRESVRGFMDRELAPRVDEYRSAHRIEREFWTKAGAQDLLGVAIPEEHGGSGLDDFRFNAVLAEETIRHGAGFASCVGIHTDICAPYLTELTTPEQQARWLPGFCSGELLTAIGMTEPEAGSDLASLRTTAVRDGYEYVINGGKTFITNGGSADLIIAAVRTGEAGPRGVSMVVIPADAPGFERGRVLEKQGQHESDTAELFFSDCRVPVTNLLGEEGHGFVYMMERLAQERLSAGVGNLAHAVEGFRQTVEYVDQRTAFGRPIGTFQNSQFKLAEMATELDVAQAYVDQCLMAHVKGRLTAVDAAKVKLHTSEVEGRVLDQCVQLYGGYGYMDEYWVSRAWADARVTRIWAGSNEIMKLVIGRDLGIGRSAAGT